MIKSTGIVRKIDELGRVVVPIEMRRTLGIDVKDSVEIHIENDKVILQKYQDDLSCHLTGKTSEDNLTLADGKITLDPDVAKSLLKEIQTKLQEK